MENTLVQVVQDFRMLTHAITVAFFAGAAIMFAYRVWSAHKWGI